MTLEALGRAGEWESALEGNGDRAWSFASLRKAGGRRSASAAACRSRSKAETLAALVCDLAIEALHREVMLTPKPGLVDRRNSGAHQEHDA